MTKHTKGPWEAHNGEVTTQQIPGRSFRRIAVIQDYGVRTLPEVDEANARLIAAAPAMLQALRDVSQAYQDMFDCMPVAWQTFDHIVNTAIQEATGEQ
jgi:hypothetical protein